MVDISEIEKQLVKKKDWLYTGEVDNKKRPTNSLLSTKEIDFEVSEQFVPISSKQNLEIQRLTLQRLREGTFDNFSYNFKEEITIEEEGNTNLLHTEEVNTNLLHTEEGNTNSLHTDLSTLLNEIEGELLKISDYGSIGFLPDVKIKIQEDKKKKKSKVRNLEKVKNVTILK